MPPISAPLPTGTTTAAGGSGIWSSSSSAITPYPSNCVGSMPSSKNGTCASAAKRLPSSLAKSRSVPASRISAPSPSIRASFESDAPAGA